MSGANVHVEVDDGCRFQAGYRLRGQFEYGGRFRRQFSIWRQVCSSRGQIFSHVKAKPVNLCRCSSAKGKLT